MTPRRTFPDRQAGHRTGAWQMIYTGFILIMLCFFILLTSFASLQPAKITQFVNSFSIAVNVLGGGKGIEQSHGMLNSQVNLLPKQDLVALLFEQVRQARDEEDIDQVGLHRSDQGVVMTLSDRLLFDSARAELSSVAYPLLEKIARLIERIPVPVEIRGHTDDRPIGTTAFASNWQLSAARALSVLRFLIEHGHADANRLAAVGFAQYQPLVPNDSPAHRALNRRVEFVFMAEK